MKQNYSRDLETGPPICSQPSNSIEKVYAQRKSWFLVQTTHALLSDLDIAIHMMTFFFQWISSLE